MAPEAVTFISLPLEFPVIVKPNDGDSSVVILDANNTPRLLEVNPNPGWCWDGHLARMAALAGMSYSDMLMAILNACDERLNVSQSRGRCKRAA